MCATPMWRRRPRRRTLYGNVSVFLRRRGCRRHSRFALHLPSTNRKSKIVNRKIVNLCDLCDLCVKIQRRSGFPTASAERWFPFPREAERIPLLPCSAFRIFNAKNAKCTQGTQIFRKVTPEKSKYLKAFADSAKSLRPLR